MVDILNTKIGLRARAVSSLPAADLVIGMPTEQAADLLPRIFNLCRMSQSAAARLAFGLPLDPEADQILARDILKDHVLKVVFKWAVHFAEPTLHLPKGWQSDPDLLRPVLFGPTECLPDDFDGFWSLLDRGEGVGRVLSKVRGAFAPFEASSSALPFVDGASAHCVTVQENSVAARQASHPVLKQIERVLGRGPLWRATAVVYDMESCLDGTLPPAALVAEGRAVVPAARGLYAVQATAEDGIVKTFHRITPTDHLLAKHGVMDQSLATLSPKSHAMAPLVLDILDPCLPVKLEEVRHA